MGLVEDALEGLAGDPEAGAQHQKDLEGGGEAFELSMTVVVVLVGGAVGDADGDEGNGGGDEVDAGVRGLAQHAERPGEGTGNELEQGDGQGSH